MLALSRSSRMKKVSAKKRGPATKQSRNAVRRRRPSRSASTSRAIPPVVGACNQLQARPFDVAARVGDPSFRARCTYMKLFGMLVENASHPGLAAVLLDELARLTAELVYARDAGTVEGFIKQLRSYARERRAAELTTSRRNAYPGRKT